MTNPHPATPTDIDISACADRVMALVRRGRVGDGLLLLEHLREGERPVVQEALDRHVASGALQHVWASALSGNLEVEHRPVLERLQQALGPPRMPAVSHRQDEPNELVGLTQAQRHDVYASMVATRGNDTARSDLQRDDYSVLLGLRRETSILASPGGGRAGTGIYDDQIVVLSRTADGEKRVFITSRASTEPTAQYSHQAGSDGSRYFSEGGQEERRITPAPGYEVVRWRTIQGEDVNNDTMRDLGRLAEGTIELHVALHDNPRSAGTREAFRPSPEQLAADRAAGMVQRDTNADGHFNNGDLNGVQDLNETFKIHGGSRNNTDSAGCQTIHPDDYLGFIRAAKSNPEQTRWQYVLTSTHDAPVRDIEVERNLAQADTEALVNIESGGNRQGNVPGVPEPFNDPILNRYLAAVRGGDAALADRIAMGFAARAPEAVQQADAARVEAERVEAEEVAAQREPAPRVREAPGLYL